MPCPAVAAAAFGWLGPCWRKCRFRQYLPVMGGLKYCKTEIKKWFASSRFHILWIAKPNARPLIRQKHMLGATPIIILSSIHLGQICADSSLQNLFNFFFNFPFLTSVGVLLVVAIVSGGRSGCSILLGDC